MPHPTMPAINAYGFPSVDAAQFLPGTADELAPILAGGTNATPWP